MPDINALTDLTPGTATANDGVVVYDFSATVGLRIKEVKFTADETEFLNGKGEFTNPTSVVLTATATAANNFTVGKVGYVIPTTGTITLANATAEATAKNMMVMATGTINGGAAGVFTVNGLVTSTTHGFALGAPLFISKATPGVITATIPTTPAIIRVVGYAIDANTIYFRPDNTWVEI
jgi:hypothetical protein